MTMDDPGDRTLRVLLVSARSQVREIVPAALAGAAGAPITLEVVEDPDAARSGVCAGSYDAVLLDFDDGAAAAELLRAAHSSGLRASPVMALTARDPDGAVAALALGAVHALPLDQAGGPLLGRLVTLVAANRALEQRLAELAPFDATTGLPRDGLFATLLGHAVKRARRNRDYLAVLHVLFDGLDGPAADAGRAERTVGAIAERLTGVLRASDTVARIDHDKFAVLVESMPRVEDIQIVAEKIAAAVAVPIGRPGDMVSLNSSVGISLYPTSAADADELMRFAGAAMYAAREKGPNHFHFY